MPQWGRPSGARRGKRRKGRDAYSEDRRFEEIDSDSDDGEGVNIESFRSDELHFTGADLGQRSRNRRARDYDDYTSESSEEEVDLRETSNTMQLALRDKEDLLVEKALERIRRAQMMGKTNVKLSKRELDALERKRRKDESSRKSSRQDLRLTDRRRSSGTSSPALKEQKPRKKIKVPYDEGTPSPGLSAPPGIVVQGHDGPSYAPLGYYPPAVAPGRRSGGTTPRSSSQQELRSPQPSQSKPKNQSKRQPSGGSSSRPSPVPETSPVSRRLPDDPNWLPRPRSASSNVPYPIDPYQYQQYSPPLPQIPSQYASSRRIVSGPPDVHYPDVQYLGTRRVAASNQPPAASSDPSLPRREHSSPSLREDSESDSGASDEGVQVDVVPYGRGYSVNAAFEGSAGRQRRAPR